MFTKEEEGTRPEIHVHFSKDKDIWEKIKRDFQFSNAFKYSAKTIMKSVFRTENGENKLLVIFRKEGCGEKGKS